MNDIIGFDENGIGPEFVDYIPPDWNEQFIRGVYWVASKSKDWKTKIGALIVKDKRIISTGYNGIPQGVNDGISERNQRPLKYSFYEHGERNSIYNAARDGISINNSVIYTSASPCIECLRAIIQSGIKKVIIHKQFNDLCKLTKREQWKDHDVITSQMIKESGIELVEFDKKLNLIGYLDGKMVKI